MSYRYALYAAAEPGSALHDRASRWLGRDAHAGIDFASPPVDRIETMLWRRITEAPRSYGFHATLKPPFRLASCCSPEMLHDALETFAREGRDVPVLHLELKELSGFLALRPVGGADAVHALADDVVRGFDGFRRPADDAELSRRRAAGLTARQEANLRQWGYPFVMEDFRLHFTLTGQLDPDTRQRVRPCLEGWMAEGLREPLPLNRLWLFEQPEKGAPFRQGRAWTID